MQTKAKMEAWLSEIGLLSTPRHELVVKLRLQILALDPGVTQEIKYGGLLFTCGRPFCGIFSYSQHVSLEFGDGSALIDKHHILEGRGQQRRHIKLRSQDDLAAKQVAYFLAQALQIAQSAALP